MLINEEPFEEAKARHISKFDENFKAFEGNVELLTRKEADYRIYRFMVLVMSDEADAIKDNF